MASELVPETHLSFVRTSISQPLTVYVPTLYRYMEERYVDAFFAEGRLRIGSFAAFRRHKDELRRDGTEGYTHLMMNDTESDRHFGAVTISGGNSYVLSTSTSLRTNSFGDACIEIFEPIGFCSKVAAEISGLNHVMLAQCMYVDRKILFAGGTPPGLDDLRDERHPDKISLEKMMSANNAMSGPKEYFLKERKYESEMEYRMIWETDRRSSDYVDIVIRNPTQFCRRRAVPN